MQHATSAPAQASLGEFSPSSSTKPRRGRKAIHRDKAAKQKAYRDRLAAKKAAAQPKRELTMNDLVAAAFREHNDYRGIFLKDAPRGMGKLIYMGGYGAQDDVADISDRQQVKERIGGTRVTPEGAGPDPDDTTVRRFQVRLADGPPPKKNQAFELIDHKIERMWEYQVYDSLRSPLEKRALSLKWLRDHGIEVSEAELTQVKTRKEQSESTADAPTVEVLRETLVDAA